MKFKSLSTRLIIFVTLSVTTMFVLVVGVMMYIQFYLGISLLNMTTMWHIDSRAATVEMKLAEVQSTIMTYDVKVFSNLHSEDKLADNFDDILHNPDIYGCGIALKPDTVRHRRCLLYAQRDGHGGVITNKRPESYAYEERDYFRETEKRMDDYWSDPYLDGDLRMATFSRPFTNDKGEFIGMLCADVLLDSICDYLKAEATTSSAAVMSDAIKSWLCADAKIFILSRSGYFIVPPDSTAHLDDTYRTYALRHNSEEFIHAGEAMMKNKAEEFPMNDITLDDKDYTIAYSYIPSLGWTVAALYPMELFNTLLALCILLVLIMLAGGSALMVVIIYLIVRRSTSPLKLLARASKNIAKGDFDVEMPRLNTHDEVSTLRDSFEDMRLSLKDYVSQLQVTTAQNERLEQELNIASRIQLAMLPTSFPHPPEVPEVSIYSYLKSAREVGGDLYDFFIRGGHLHFVIGDVSGKGTPAAMIMSVTISMFRALQRRDVVPERTMNALNNMLLERGLSDMFVTLMVGDLNLATGELSMCNAGHNPPMLIHEGKPQYMQMHTNIPIGVLSGYHYRPDHFVMARGERLLLYTDGVTEAGNANDDMFGEERLLAAAKKYNSKEVDAFISSLVNDLLGFTGDTPQSDDITLMLLQYHGSGQILMRELSFADNMSAVTSATTMINEVCEQLAIAPDVSMALQLALEEAMVNIINYAHADHADNADNAFTITSDGKVINFTLSDNGIAFDPTQAAMPDITLGIEQRREGGLGIFLVKKIMDSVTYRRVGNRNILTMKKHL